LSPPQRVPSNAKAVAAEYPPLHTSSRRYGAARGISALAAEPDCPNVAGVIDMRTDPWVTGTGIDRTPTRDGNADDFISTDGRHPTRAGFENLALRLTDEIAPSGSDPSSPDRTRTVWPPDAGSAARAPR
jgi:hypothetical protein